ncbi:MAG: flavin reductase family protein [Flammeovirgaceae bacterium]|jgi:flavin reductase (DIM6/NTAB) family NADH-FMN oxidoreductase RutF|nr:flavin reductase family protein [Flammeovirgaceae bacterium]
MCMLTVSIDEIKGWDRFYRANFINSLSGFKSASLISTVSPDGKTNVAIFSNIVHIGADPALIGFVNRPKEAAPHTLSNIERTGVYTINLVDKYMAEKAHLSSAKYEEGISEFDALQIDIDFLPEWKAPLVKDAVCSYGLKVAEIIPISLNGTYFVIGAIQWVKVNKSIMCDDGFLALQEVETICSLGIDAYYTTALVNRWEYAKPFKKAESIDAVPKLQQPTR